MMPISLAIAGPAAERFGLQTWYLMGGILCALIAIFSLTSRSLLRIEDGPPQGLVAQPQPEAAD